MEEGSLIFKNVSFSLPAGGAMLVQGANGAGKTSLLDMIVGDLPPVAGRLIWDSVLCDSGGLQLKRWEAERFCWFEDPGLPQITPNITVQQQIELFSINSNTHYSATHVLKLMRLWELRDLMTNILSTGQRKRLALSRLALVARPVWLLDEPTLGLDTQSIALLEAMIRDHRQRGGMLIIASHADIALENAVSLRM
ncbi:heme ABC exporter [Capsaspora owczarzaki ATCC 30864]|uniref:Heme ABC exporter n=1 Tax=Capsaspora owczarzaki (strain ATCC 30864) TaxID=595528 RepID=A0A0D2U5D7_CAPO3|nr:heme ABC exporter [Capsaspora owczarzaki ATCC 30864]KJE90361.1 heme ABC exporter [Capsaspora owczarzaki ATCC 30864]|eukprot:XP_004364551.1 heme ABC exporter [Capsaspora owczarzaki ATCC 30864]